MTQASYKIQVGNNKIVIIFQSAVFLKHMVLPTIRLILSGNHDQKS